MTKYNNIKNLTFQGMFANRKSETKSKVSGVDTEQAVELGDNTDFLAITPEVDLKIGWSDDGNDTIDDNYPVRILAGIPETIQVPRHPSKPKYVHFKSADAGAVRYTEL